MNDFTHLMGKQMKFYEELKLSYLNKMKYEWEIAHPPIIET